MSQTHNLTCYVCNKVIGPDEPYETDEVDLTPHKGKRNVIKDVRHARCQPWVELKITVGDGYDYVSDL